MSNPACCTPTSAVGLQSGMLWIQHAVPMPGERSLLCNLSPRVLRLAPCNLATVWGLTVIRLS